MDDLHVNLSKFLSKVLRHDPAMIGVSLDAQGWTQVDDLLLKAERHGKRISLNLLKQIVANDSKQRYAFSDDGLFIRANQGHSVEVDLGLASRQPPDVLYHGTPRQFVDSIRRQGLLKGKRHHVHLSVDVPTAIKVGERRGKPVVLEVQAAAMYQAGLVFYRSENGVWLTESVPPQYILFPST